MDKTAGLSAAEAYILLSLPRYDVGKALKLGFMGLLAQGVLRSEDETRTGLFRTRHVIHLRVAPNLPDALPPITASLVKVVRAVEAKAGVMTEIVKQSRREYGPNLSGFGGGLVCPALARRGLAEQRRVKVLGLFPTTRYERTPAGDAEKARVSAAVDGARSIPQYLDSDPAQAVALAVAAGGAILLIDELQPHFQGIAKAMRDRGDGGNSGGDGGGWDGGGSVDAGGGFDPSTLAGFDAGAIDFGSVDFGSIDFGGFDAGFSDAGGDGGGDGGGGDGGSSGC